jgi:hypothetical protein
LTGGYLPFTGLKHMAEHDLVHPMLAGSRQGGSYGMATEVHGAQRLQ